MPLPCKPYAGSVDSGGYGRVWVPGERKHRLAHRVAYEEHYGPIPTGKVVRHKCDNPVCVEPSHLELGTQRENVLDMMRRGRGRGQILSSIPADIIAQVVPLLATGMSQKAVAEELGIAQASVSRIKHNKERVRA